LFNSLRNIGTQLAVTFVLLFFLLASGEMMKEKLVRVSPRFRDKKRSVAIWRQVEREVSNYLFSITLINIGFGFAVGAGLYLVGMPNAVVWGAMAILLNYIPYLGALE
jgi:predicted PurR-regulated permease PerM